MKYKMRPEDFVVEEQIRLPRPSSGSFALCRVRKRGVTTLGVQVQMARRLGVPRSDVVFPALKDKEAVAVQHAAIRGTMPARMSGRGFEAEFLRRSVRPLSPSDILSNRFTITLRDLSPDGAARIQERLPGVAQTGLPNYFDQQRFGSVTPGQEHIAKRILRRDVEGALRAYLTQPFVGDPAPVRAFKSFAADHWGEWEVLFQAAPRPSNFRSVLTYMRDHPTEEPAERAIHLRKALNLINRRLLSIYLTAYQSLLWNRIVGRYLAARLGEGTGKAQITIAGERLPLCGPALAAFDDGAAVPLPSHRAVYADPDLSAIVDRVLTEEGLALNDLKARVLKKAYLSKGKRALVLRPRDASALSPEPDDLCQGRVKLTLQFTLPRGSYATLVLKTVTLA